ncbi:MAG: hypothetical protein U1F39_01985 [Steroidobacteraceae bacterium]
MRTSPALKLAIICAASMGIARAADSPGKLRSEMAKAERDYIALYNKLNTTPEFAIVCRMDTPTGTSFAVRVCEPKYLIAANARSASQRMQSAVAAGNSTGSANSGGPNVGAGAAGDGGTVTVDKDAAFRQNMLDLLQKNAELKALGDRRDELQARYDEATRGKSSR